MSFLSELATVRGRYRYLVCASRLAGGPKNSGRENASLGQKLLHESAANGRLNDETDYIEADTINEIDSDNPHQITLTAPEDSAHYTHYSVYRTDNILSEDADLATVENVFAYCKDIPVAKVAYCTTVFKSDGNKYVAGDGAQNSLLLSCVYRETFNTDDIGSTLKAPDGSEYQIVDVYSTVRAVIISIISTSGSQITEAKALSLFNNTVWIGSDRCYRFLRQEDSSGAVEYVVLASLFGTAISSSDEGKQLFFWDNKTAIIKDVYDSLGETVLRVFEPNGPPSSYEINSLDNYFATIGISERKYNDSVDQITLRARIESGDDLYYLQTRYHDPLPDGNLGAVAGGAYFASSKKLSEYYYTQLGNLYRAGCYRPDAQINKEPVGAITRLKEYGNSALVIFEKHSTSYVDTTVIENAGDIRFGEFVPIFRTPVLITDKIGCPTEGNAARISSSAEIIVTGEPAVRMFDGFKYGENLADGSVQNSEIVKYYQSVVAIWNSRSGLRISGVQKYGS